MEQDCNQYGSIPVACQSRSCADGLPRHSHQSAARAMARAGAARGPGGGTGGAHQEALRPTDGIPKQEGEGLQLLVFDRPEIRPESSDCKGSERNHEWVVLKPSSFRPWNPELTLLLPPSPADSLLENHLVFFLINLVTDLDLEAIHAFYRQKDPRGCDGVPDAEDGGARSQGQPGLPSGSGLQKLCTQCIERQSWGRMSTGVCCAPALEQCSWSGTTSVA